MANGKRGRPRKVQPETERVAVVSDDPGIEWEVQPAQEPHPTDREASREARTESRHGVGRKQRKPLGVPRQRLHAEVPKGMRGRWMNDDPGRIEQALEGDYVFISSDAEVVQTREGARTEIVGTGRNGGAKTGYLMAIPTVLYDEDHAAKMSQIKETEDSIKRGGPEQAAESDRGTYYTPSEGINIRPNTSAER